MSVRDTLTAITVQSVIAMIIIVGGLAILAFNNPTTDIKIAVVGLMSTVVGYYFGSSRSTAKKDDTIADIAKSGNGQ